MNMNRLWGAKVIFDESMLGKIGMGSGRQVAIDGYGQVTIDGQKLKKETQSTRKNHDRRASYDCDLK